MKTTRRSPRYSLSTDYSGACLLRLNADSWLGDANSTREFRSCGGYVHEIFESGKRTQLCETMVHSGNALTSSEEGLLTAIRYEVRACLRAEARADREAV